MTVETAGLPLNLAFNEKHDFSRGIGTREKTWALKGSRSQHSGATAEPS